MSCRCGAPSVRTIAAIAYCDGCAERFLEPIRRRVLAREIADESGIGSGRPVRRRDDLGEMDFDLECTVCGATWSGEAWEICGYCIRFCELANEAQRKVALYPDLPDVGDDRRGDALRAWAHRLAGLVKADVIAEHEAHAAWNREVQRVA